MLGGSRDVCVWGGGGQGIVRGYERGRGGGGGGGGGGALETAVLKFRFDVDRLLCGCLIKYYHNCPMGPYSIGDITDLDK